MMYKVGEIVQDIFTGYKYKVLSELRPGMRAECLLLGTKEIFLKSALDLKPVNKTMTNIDNTLSERGSRYGKFCEVATTCQALKSAMRSSPNWNKLTASQKEALENIQSKIGRMLNGDPTYEDNAVDIVGYATLMLKNMQGDTEI